MLSDLWSSSIAVLQETCWRESVVWKRYYTKTDLSLRSTGVSSIHRFGVNP